MLVVLEGFERAETPRRLLVQREEHVPHGNELSDLRAELDDTSGRRGNLYRYEVRHHVDDGLRCLHGVPLSNVADSATRFDNNPGCFVTKDNGCFPGAISVTATT